MIHKPIVVVGSINLDLVATAERIPAVGETISGLDFQIHPGGKGANQAVAVARLGYPVRMIGRVGTDTFASFLKDNLESAGVNTAGVVQTEGPSGVAQITVSKNGENSIVVVPGANSMVSPEDLAKNLAIIQGAGMVLTQLEIPLETVEYLSCICSRESVPLILDPAPARELPNSVMQRVDWFTPNESEAAFFIGQRTEDSSSEAASQTARMLLADGCWGVVLKMGSRGVYLASQGEIGESIPAFNVSSIDTTAAGDAFNGGFAVGLMQGKTPRESAIFAEGVAAISVTRVGAQSSMPTLGEVEYFLREQSGNLMV